MLAECRAVHSLHQLGYTSIQIIRYSVSSLHGSFLWGRAEAGLLSVASSIIISGLLPYVQQMLRISLVSLLRAFFASCGHSCNMDLLMMQNIRIPLVWRW